MSHSHDWRQVLRGAGVSEGKSEQVLHGKGGTRESPGPGTQGQRQSEPAPPRVLVGRALEAGPTAAARVQGSVPAGVLGGEGAEEAEPWPPTVSHTHKSTQM